MNTWAPTSNKLENDEEKKQTKQQEVLQLKIWKTSVKPQFEPVHSKNCGETDISSQLKFRNVQYL